MSAGEAPTHPAFQAWSKLGHDVPVRVVTADCGARRLSALNIRVVPSPDGPAVYVFDWEKSGQGMIAVDFVRGLNIDAYHAIVRERGLRSRVKTSSGWQRTGESCAC